MFWRDKYLIGAEFLSLKYAHIYQTAVLEIEMNTSHEKDFEIIHLVQK